jgi:hypothetical protein
MKPWHLAAAALAAALAFGLWWGLRDRFEKVEIERDVGYRGEARSNPYFAVQELYTGLGAPARTLPGALDKLPPDDHAILLLSERRAITRPRLDALESWVRRGGRLVVALDEAPSLDPILKRFGVRAVGDPEEVPGRETVEMATGTGAIHLEIAKAPRLVDSRREANFVARSPSGVFLLRYFLGRGRVIVVSDGSFLTNAEIGRLGHARAAWALVDAVQGPVHGVWLVVREDMPTLLGLLARHAAAASVSFLLLLGAWLWSAGSRFGPALPDPPRDRRSLLEHIQAAGEFLLRIGRAEDLAQATREALMRRVEVREPEWSKLPVPELAKRLAGLPGVGGLSERRIESALRPPVLGAADLATTVQTLETLRRAL